MTKGLPLNHSGTYSCEVERWPAENMSGQGKWLCDISPIRTDFFSH